MRRAAVILVAYFTALAVVVTATARDRTPRRVVGHGLVKFDGVGPERWAARYRRERRAASALRRLLAARLDRVVYLVRSFECVHRYEGSWTAATGNGFYGGLQMDMQFQQAYGGELLSVKGTANNWTPAEQMSVAIRAHASRGFYPWPNTARACGLIR